MVFRVKQQLLFLGVFLAAALCNGQVISEFMASNDSFYPTAAGAYEDWIEIHNTTGATLDLAGWYLTDDPTNLRKWAFPSINAAKLSPNGYLVVFADGAELSVIGSELHASLKLSAGGEYLALVEDDGETVAHQYFPKFPDQTTDVSYGLDSVSGQPTYFAVPTPGTANGQGIADAVQFSAVSRTFTNTFSLSLSVPSPTASIRYTTDGSLPSTNSTRYTAPITVSGTAQIRAQAFDPGRTDGPLRSETFIHLDADAVAFTSDLPLVIVENFGAGDIPGPTNGYRQISQVMFFEPVDGVCRLTEKPAVASRAGINRRGETSLRVTTAKPSLAVETWGEIDEETRSIEPLGFPAESDWILSAPLVGIDPLSMRNPFIYEVSNDAGFYAVRLRFVEVFLSYSGGSITASKYNGLYILMEKIKIDPNRVDITKISSLDNTEPDISGGYLWKKDKIDDTNDTFKAGGLDFTYVTPDGSEITPAQENWLTNYINAAKAAMPNGNYKAYIDMESFADHFIFNLFGKNVDGLGFSTFLYKDRNAPIHMGPIWDFDRSMAADGQAGTTNPAYWGAGDTSSYFGKLWYGSLRAAPDFWAVWIDRWQAIREGPFSEAAIDARIEKFRTELSAAAIRDIIRWPRRITAAQWSGEVDWFKNWLITRAQWMDDQLPDPPVFSLSGGLVASGTTVTLGCGTNKIYYTRNGADPRASGGSPSGTLYSAPITITSNTAIKTRGWNSGIFTTAPETWPWSALREAVFVVNPATLAITEIMYHPRSPTNVAELVYSTSDFEFIEVQNTNATTACSLTGIQLLDGVSFSFTPNTTLGGGQYGVIVANLDAFKLRYTNWASLNILGTYTGKLSDTGERLQLGYANTNIPGRISFDYEDDWYSCTDGEGFSLVLNNPQSAPSTWDSKTAWRYSSAIDGTPGAANPALTYPVGTLVINEVLSHQDIDNPGDWIELRNTSGSSINISGWFLSDSRGNLQKYTIPAGTTIPANGYVVFTEYSHFKTNFALSEFGDTVYLSAGSGGNLATPAYRESASFGAQERNVTFGRYTKSDGTTEMAAMISATRGTTNSAPRVGPVVFDQIMYNPPEGGYEYIRLKNSSGATVPLYDPANPSNTWKVSGIDFDFPPGVELTAGDSLILVRDTIDAALFRTACSIPASIDIYNYSGALDDAGETLDLKKPGVPESGTGYVPYITVEQVKYNDRAPWPESADGLGQAIGRINPATYGNDVINWQAVSASYSPTFYALTVTSGSGSGPYLAGTVVPIQAESLPQHTFDRWVGDVSSISNVTAASTTLTMPASNSTVTATYVSNVTVRLTVISGYGSGEYDAETVIPIQARSQPSKAFFRWAGNVAGVSNVTAESTLLTMSAADATVTAVYTSNTTFIAKGSAWKYHDQGQDLGTAWREPGYDDSGWASGAAPLGYPTGTAVTVVSYGPDSKNKYITTYFRQRFTVQDFAPMENLTLQLLRDDGAVVYINGIEVVRDNMPTNAISYVTRPSSTVGGADETTFFSFSIPSSTLVSETNVIAIEIHQASATSSDLSMNASLESATEESVPDGDNDGMADAWETTQFGSTETGLPEVDSDGDGQRNLEEYISGSDPTNAASRFIVNRIAASGMEWTVLTGRVYSIYWTSNLLSQPFVEIASGLTQSNFTDNVHTGSVANYYRIKVEME